MAYNADGKLVGIEILDASKRAEIVAISKKCLEALHLCRFL